MKITLALCLPRDAESVSFVRHLCRFSLMDLGTDREIIDDIEVAVSEACTNVLDHSAGHEEFEVRVDISDSRCDISVIDVAGKYFKHRELGLGQADPESDSGRGIQLVRSLVDDLKFTMDPDKGVGVHLIKHLGRRGSRVLPIEDRERHHEVTGSARPG